jgi:carbohydrate diacid regulator
MMDHAGIIIASTNQGRIGAYHAGAYRIITERLQELVISGDGEYEGARQGINLPVVLNGDIVGVIGVTGEYNEVHKYSRIIKRMTEILLLENYSAELKKADEQIRRQFFDDWLLNEYHPDDKSFIERGQHFGLDTAIPRRVLAVKIAERYSDTVNEQSVMEGINKVVRMITEEIKNSIFTRTGSLMVCLVAEENDEKLRSIAEKIKSNVKKLYDLDVLTGIDSFDRNLNRAFIKAKKALRTAQKFPNGICFYHDITLEIFIDEIAPASKEEFIRHIFGGCTEAEVEKWMGILPVYFNTNGSINRTADQLLIHKNTLQYHLKKLSDQTGRDPRNITDAALYYLAYQLYYDDKPLLLVTKNI